MQLWVRQHHRHQKVSKGKGLWGDGSSTPSSCWKSHSFQCKRTGPILILVPTTPPHSPQAHPATPALTLGGSSVTGHLAFQDQGNQEHIYTPEQATGKGSQEGPLCSAMSTADGGSRAKQRERASSSDVQVSPEGSSVSSGNAGAPRSRAPSPAFLGWLVFLKFPLSLGGLSGAETVLVLTGGISVDLHQSGVFSHFSRLSADIYPASLPLPSTQTHTLCIFSSLSFPISLSSPF